MMHEMLHPDLGPVVLSESQSSHQGGTHGLSGYFCAAELRGY